MSARRPRAGLTVRAFGGVVDLVAVERVVTGAAPRPELTAAERQMVVRRLLEDGHGASMVARQLRVSGDVARTLVRRMRAADATNAPLGAGV